MNPERTRTDVWVGLLVVMGLVAVVFLALKAANLLSWDWGGGGHLVHAKFDNIGGLKVRAPVKSAGVVVGRVEAIAFDTRSYQARVDLRMDPRYPFPKDSALKILTSGLLGEQYVGIEAGSDAAMLVAGDTLGNTQSAVVLENLIGQFLYNKAADGGERK